MEKLFLNVKVDIMRLNKENGVSQVAGSGSFVEILDEVFADRWINSTVDAPNSIFSSWDQRVGIKLRFKISP